MKQEIFNFFPGRDLFMRIELELEPEVALFYARIARSHGLPLEQVLRDALFKLAGELSLEALERGRQNCPL